MSRTLRNVEELAGADIVFKFVALRKGFNALIAGFTGPFYEVADFSAALGL